MQYWVLARDVHLTSDVFDRSFSKPAVGLVHNEFLSRNGYLLLGGVVFLLGVIIVFILVRENIRTGKRSFLDILLLWPLAIKQHREKTKDTSGKLLLVGLVIMALLVLGGIVLHPGVR
jgi:hypothetical protein